MDGEVDGGDGIVVSFFPPTWKLLVVNHGLGVEEIETIVDKSQGERIMILFGPSMDVGRIFVHVAFLDDQPRDNNEHKGKNVSIKGFICH